MADLPSVPASLFAAEEQELPEKQASLEIGAADEGHVGVTLCGTQRSTGCSTTACSSFIVFHPSVYFLLPSLFPRKEASRVENVVNCDCAGRQLEWQTRFAV